MCVCGAEASSYCLAISVSMLLLLLLVVVVLLFLLLCFVCCVCLLVLKDTVESLLSVLAVQNVKCPDSTVSRGGLRVSSLKVQLFSWPAVRFDGVFHVRSCQSSLTKQFIYIYIFFLYQSKITRAFIKQNPLYFRVYFGLCYGLHVAI